MEGRAWIWGAVVIIVALAILWWSGVFGGGTPPAPVPEAPATTQPAPQTTAPQTTGG